MGLERGFVPEGVGATAAAGLDDECVRKAEGRERAAEAKLRAPEGRIGPAVALLGLKGGDPAAGIPVEHRRVDRVRARDVAPEEGRLGIGRVSPGGDERVARPGRAERVGLPREDVDVVLDGETDRQPQPTRQENGRRHHESSDHARHPAFTRGGQLAAGSPPPPSELQAGDAEAYGGEHQRARLGDDGELHDLAADGAARKVGRLGNGRERDRQSRVEVTQREVALAVEGAVVEPLTNTPVLYVSKVLFSFRRNT